MDPNLVSAMAALVGAVIGGLTSVLTSSVAQQLRTRTEWRREAHSRREELYKTFIENAAQCYADALQHDEPDVSGLVALYALIDTMYVHSSAKVIAAAEDIRVRIVDTYLDPNRGFQELRGMIADGSIVLLRSFSEACRIELEELRAGRQ